MTGTHGGFSEIDLQDSSIEKHFSEIPNPTLASNRGPLNASEADLLWFYGPPQPEDIFVGKKGNTEKETNELNIALFSRICAHMEKTGGIETAGYQDNIYVPAGYTYFGQLVAHDIAHTGSSRPLASVSIEEIANFREFPLQLDTVYGGGPEAMPWLYEPESQDSPGVPPARLRFRIAITEASLQDPRRTHNDLLRIDKCPLTLGVCDVKRFEPIVADPRNEDNLILSQVTVMIKKFHNAVMNILQKEEESNIPEDDIDKQEKAKILFETCKKIVVLCYRKMILNDYLRKILCKEIFRELKPSTINGEDFATFLENRSRRISSLKNKDSGDFDFRLGAEFAMAAFRFGHAMVQNRYLINEHHTTRNGGTSASELKHFLEFGREDSFVKHPLRQDWVMDPDMFFFVVPEYPDLQGMKHEDKLNWIKNKNDGRRHLNFSRRIRAGIASQLIVKREFALKNVIRRKSADVGDIKGGIPLRTLTRTFGKDMWTGQALARKLQYDGKIVDPSHICRTFEAQGFLTKQDIIDIKKKTPLFLYILLEAESENEGYKLGTVASRIIMDSFEKMDSMSPIKMDSETEKGIKVIKKQAGGEIDTIQKMIKFTSENTIGG